MSTENLRELIGKIAAGAYSEEELVRFREAVKALNKDSFMETYEFLCREVSKYPPEELDPAFKELMEQRLDVLEADRNFLPGNLVSARSDGSRRFLFERRWWSYAAAAVLTGFILLCGYSYLFTKREIAVIPQRPLKNDVAPGHSGALLTLSSGKKILLDSAGNGILTRDADIEVIKKDGEITYRGKTGEMMYNDVSTPKGRQWQLTLSDGTKVWLNSVSSIRYPLTFIGPERVVEITGEVYFEVAKNARQPFKVKAGNMVIEDIGTHFNINSYSDESMIRTTLVEGSVKVINGSSSVIIKPGEQASQAKGANNITVSPADVESDIAWKNGFFRFNKSDLQTVMRQISRWYDVDISYEDNMPPALQFGGKMEMDLNLSEVLDGLEKSQVHFKLEGKKLIVMP